MQYDETWCCMMHDDDFMTMKRISAGWTFWFGSLLVKNSGPQVSWNKSLRNYDHFCIQPPVANLYEFCALKIDFFFRCHGLHFRMVSGARQSPELGSLRCHWSYGWTSEAQQILLWSKVADVRLLEIDSWIPKDTFLESIRYLQRPIQAFLVTHKVLGLVLDLARRAIFLDTLGMTWGANNTHGQHWTTLHRCECDATPLKLRGVSCRYSASSYHFQTWSCKRLDNGFSGARVWVRKMSGFGSLNRITLSLVTAGKIKMLLPQNAIFGGTPSNLCYIQVSLRSSNITIGHPQWRFWP